MKTDVNNMWKVRENLLDDWDKSSNKEGAIYIFCSSKFHVYSYDSKSLKKLQLLIHPANITFWKNGQWRRKYV